MQNETTNSESIPCSFHEGRFEPCAICAACLELTLEEVDGYLASAAHRHSKAAKKGAHAVKGSKSIVRPLPSQFSSPRPEPV